MSIAYAWLQLQHANKTKIENRASLLDSERALRGEWPRFPAAYIGRRWSLRSAAAAGCSVSIRIRRPCVLLQERAHCRSTICCRLRVTEWVDSVDIVCVSAATTAAHFRSIISRHVTSPVSDELPAVQLRRVGSVRRRPMPIRLRRQLSQHRGSAARHPVSHDDAASVTGRQRPRSTGLGRCNWRRAVSTASVLSQCSTLVRNTVVRATLKVNGKPPILGTRSPLTPWPINLIFDMGDYVGNVTPNAKKCKNWPRRAGLAKGEVWRSNLGYLLFFIFIGFLALLVRPHFYEDRHHFYARWRVSVGIDFLGGLIVRVKIFPLLNPKTSIFRPIFGQKIFSLHLQPTWCDPV